MQSLNLDYHQARPIITRDWRRLEMLLVGCGGTGSWLAPHVTRLARLIVEAGKEVSLLFVDPDTVEANNVPRQNFIQAEVGYPKAERLAQRYSAAWGLSIASSVERLSEHYPISSYDDAMVVLIGCVDNAAARGSISTVLRRLNRGEKVPRAWWLDCGNLRDSGQVLLGSSEDEPVLRGAFGTGTLCTALPSPALVAHDLLEPRPEELEGNNLSCAEMTLLNAQSLSVNNRVAAEAADYLLRLLITHDLKRFASYFAVASGSARSVYTTPEAVATAMGVSADYFESKAPGRKRVRVEVAA